MEIELHDIALNLLVFIYSKLLSQSWDYLNKAQAVFELFSRILWNNVRFYLL